MILTFEQQKREIDSEINEVKEMIKKSRLHKMDSERMQAEIDNLRANIEAAERLTLEERQKFEEKTEELEKTNKAGARLKELVNCDSYAKDQRKQIETNIGQLHREREVQQRLEQRIIELRAELVKFVFQNDI